MSEHFAENIVFENIQQGQVTMRLEGLNAFKIQAEEALGIFLWTFGWKFLIFEKSEHYG